MPNMTFKRIFTVLTAIALSVLVCTSAFALTGSGTLGNPYVIATAADLTQFAEIINAGDSSAYKYAHLTADINLNNLPWTPIGSSSKTAFNGSFSGNNHTISNINCSLEPTGAAAAGLFGYITGGSTIIKDLNISGSVVKITYDAGAPGEKQYAGGLAGHVAGGVITQCSVQSTPTAIYDGDKNDVDAIAGGIAGYLNGSVTNSYCIATVSVINTSKNVSANIDAAVAGGIAGECGANGTIKNCVVSGTVSSIARTNSGGSKGALAGGAAGIAGSVTNCMSTAASTASATGVGAGARAAAGGVAGLSSGAIRHSIATGSVLATGGSLEYAGGVAGVNEGNISICGWRDNAEISPANTIGVGLNTGALTDTKAYSAAEMPIAAIVLDKYSYSGKSVKITTNTGITLDGGLEIEVPEGLTLNETEGPGVITISSGKANSISVGSADKTEYTLVVTDVKANNALTYSPSVEFVLATVVTPVPGPDVVDDGGGCNAAALPSVWKALALSMLALAVFRRKGGAANERS